MRSITLALWLVAPSLLLAQDNWNSPATMERVFLGMSARMLPVEDSSLTSYTARAEGHIYFYLDREAGDPVPMMVDQVALDVHWQYPAAERQVIRAMRRQRLLPVNNFRYYSDRVSLVVDGYADVIRIGDGRDVTAVLHPLAPGADSIYRYRVIDSLAIRPLTGDPIEVVAVEFEPQRNDIAAAVGTVFLDRADGALVRFQFSFTPVAYADRRVDVITVELEYALWEARFWLPFRQRLTVRRESPEFDLPFASVIRSVLEVSDYQLNPVFADGFFDGPPLVYPDVTRFSGDTLRFTTGVLDRLDEEDLSPPAEPIDLQEELESVVDSKVNSGLPATRLGVRSVSSIARFNRAEGLFLGGGFSRRLHPALLRVSGGYRSEARSPEIDAALLARLGVGVAGVRWFFREGVDLGPFRGAAGAVNSLSSLVLASDYLDLYRRSGFEASYRVDFGNSRFRVSAGAADESGFVSSLSDSPLQSGFRGLRTVGEGRREHVAIELRRSGLRFAGFRGAALATTRASRFETNATAAFGLSLRATRWLDVFTRLVEVEALAQVVATPAAPQDLLTLGGRNTLPGYGYREFAGTRLIFVKMGFLQDLKGKTVALRAGFSVGSLAGGNDVVPPDWGAISTDGVRASVSAGLSFMLDLVRVEVGRALVGGGWELFLSANPAIGELL